MLAKKMKQFISRNSNQILVFMLFLAILYNIFIPANVGHADELGYSMEYHEKAVPQNRLPKVQDKQPIEIFDATLTAYSSTADQCSGNPFITASGARVHDGTIAANCLPFGTKVKFPDIYGDKVFVVEDRLAARMGCNTIDIWFPDRGSALGFGRAYTKVEVF
ncbi:MAG: hypothetical protein ABH831_01680 [Candidatus Nealsonbacteria bacterium]